MVDTFGTLPAEVGKYYDRLLLSRALPTLYLPKIGQARNLPKNNGNNVSYPRFNTLATVTTALTEGLTPNPTNLSVTEVTGTVAEYGNYVEVSDALDLMAVDQVIRESVTLLGENGGQSVEEIMRAELVTGTSVLYATGSTRGAQTASSPITLSLVRKATRNLNANNAMPFYGERDGKGQGGMYIGYIHPNAWYDLQGDTQVLNTFSYSDPDKLYTLDLPTLGGVAWIVSTKAPIFSGQGLAGADVYGTFVFGREAFGALNVAGTGMWQTLVKQVGSSGAADPLNQRGSIGWKSFQMPKILNNTFFLRIEAGVSP